MDLNAITSSPLIIAAIVVVGLVGLAALAVVAYLAYAYFQGRWPFDRGHK